MLDAIIPLISLILLEVILGIDNVIFISILSDKLPDSQRNKLRYWGLGLAMLMRLILLTLFTIAGISFSGKGIILIAGGLFLIYKSTVEIYHKTELANQSEVPVVPKTSSFKRLLMEIILLDLVFSIDSIITAIGMAQALWVMYTSVIVAVVIMIFASQPISFFIKKHPSFKILALSFLMMIGISLIAEGFHLAIPKGYIYFSMAFAFIVDIIQMKTVK
jgi:predicted tellurium resistance membrane protein TerC